MSFTHKYGNFPLEYLIASCQYVGMVCIYCGATTKVINSRAQVRMGGVWRRRRCLACNNIFTTVENPDLSSSIAFERKLNDFEPFSRDKLLISVYESLRHRKSALEDAQGLTDTIWSKLIPNINTAAISRVDVISITTAVLKRFDKAAAVYYAAYHFYTSD